MSDQAGGASLGIGASLAIALAMLVVRVLIVMVGGAHVIPWALVQVARLRSHELITLATAAASCVVVGASMALGALVGHHAVRFVRQAHGNIGISFLPVPKVGA